MEIKSLENVELEDVVGCLCAAFEDYFVQMPSNVEYWRNRFFISRVDWSHSWGVFDKGRLVAFVVNGIDRVDNDLTAFNTGTGVLNAYRGRQLVDQMYQFGTPGLMERGVNQCQLEVITENYRAIRVYERIGFNKSHRVKCYKGEIPDCNKVTVEKCDLRALNLTKKDDLYSWDHTASALKMAGNNYQYYQVQDEKTRLCGYFVIHPENNGYIARLESPVGNWEGIFCGVSQITNEIKINNVHESRTELIKGLNELGVAHSVDQFVMTMNLE